MDEILEYVMNSDSEIEGDSDQEVSSEDDYDDEDAFQNTLAHLHEPEASEINQNIVVVVHLLI